MRGIPDIRSHVHEINEVQTRISIIIDLNNPNNPVPIALNINFEAELNFKMRNRETKTSYVQFVQVM